MKRPVALLAACCVLLLAACATVSTEVVSLAPELKLPPSQNVEILFEKPARPYREIALLETRGLIGDTEVQLWQDARAKAQALGADALIRLELDKTVQAPMVVYDPLFYGPYYPSWYPHPFFYPYAYPEYRVIPGGPVYTLKSVAIKYDTSPSGTTRR
ncbi:MAG TPA: hypothetical protein VFK15_07000 [Burkholderiales bacterium]|jgi:hypothetical protein|nr:hypothetical protein [Burkholderiales bacterium]